jgi:putative tricarboxylic transport membrane protein
MNRYRRFAVVLASMMLILASCTAEPSASAETSASPETSAEGSQPAASADTSAFTEDVEVVVHSGPGGGNDTLSRAMAQILLDEGLAETLYPVSNVEGGSGAAAMAYMAEQAGEPNTWAVHTAVWITTPLTLGGDVTTVTDLTPIATLVEERGMIAVKADSPYETVQDLVDASLAGEQIVQAGGSVGSLDQVNSLLIQQLAGVEWAFLPFEGGGERVAAVLGGNADIMIEGARDFTELVESGDMRVIAAVSSERNPIFPDVPTVAESTEYDPPFVVERRGVIGPPDMPAEAVAYWADLFEQMMETDAWKTFSEESGFVDAYGGPDVHAENMAAQEATLREVFEGLGLLN